jgi:hypothetical protein
MHHGSLDHLGRPKPGLKFLTCLHVIFTASELQQPVFTSLNMPEPFKWNSLAGHILCRKILKETPLQFEPHDWQIDGVCQSLDGVNLLAITPTGSGKTSYYIMYILVVLAIVKNPTLCLTAKYPENPCLIVICPTIPLQLEMVSEATLVQRRDAYIF